MSLETVIDSIVQTVQDLLANKPRLSLQVLYCLVRDVAAVASGLRTAFMLDYCQLQAQQLIDITTCIVQTLQLQIDKLALLLINDCCLLVYRPLLTNSGNLQQPLFVTFPACASGGLTPTWASSNQTQSLIASLRSLWDLLLQSETPKAQKTPIPCIDCDALALEGELPCMPTLVGLLLGYPAVYIVENLDQAQAVSRCLSSTTLQVYSLTTCLGSVTANGGRGGGGYEAGRGQLPPLMGWSVPSALVKDAEGAEERGPWEEHWKKWKVEMKKRWTASNAMLQVRRKNNNNNNRDTDTNLQWSTLTYEAVSCMRPIAL